MSVDCQSVVGETFTNVCRVNGTNRAFSSLRNVGCNARGRRKALRIRTPLREVSPIKRPLILEITNERHGMKITSHLLEAYFQCPTKCSLRASDLDAENRKSAG